MHQFWYKLEWSSAENRVSENISVEHILMWEDNWDIWSFPIFGAIEMPLRDETFLPCMKSELCVTLSNGESTFVPQF